MKARGMRYTGVRKIELIEVDVPDPGFGQVQVQVATCGICASDIFAYTHGKAGWGAGHEGVGRIVRIGPGVTGYKEGDRVTAKGLGFASLRNCNIDGVYPIPADSKLPDEQWMVEPVSCIVTGLDHCALKAGDRVAVVGCGYMGLMLVQGLAHSLADRLIGLELIPARLELARRFGVGAAYNPNDPGFDKVFDELKALQLDTVVDASGTQSGLELATKLVKRGGRINLFGWNHGTASFSGDAWHIEGLTVVNSAPNSALRDPWPAAIRLIHRGLIDQRDLVTHVAPLDDCARLLDLAAERKDGYIKGVVRIG